MVPDLSQLEEDEELTSEITEDTIPNRTYKLDFTEGCVKGKIDDEDALKQAIMKILNTHAMEHEIYSYDYGIELKDLYGGHPPYVRSEVKRRIKEAILLDDRFTDVTDFKDSYDHGKLSVSFTVVTEDGENIVIEEGVTI